MGVKNGLCQRCLDKSGKYGVYMDQRQNKVSGE